MEKKGLYWKLVQGDMTTRSVASALEAADGDNNEDDDDVIIPQEDHHFKRAVSRQSTRASLNRETAIRGSLRLGSVSSTRVNSITAPDVLPQINSITPLSLNRETAIRGSLRLGSVSSARVNSITAPDVLPQILPVSGFTRCNLLFRGKEALLAKRCRFSRRSLPDHVSAGCSLNRETAIRSLAASLNRETAIRSLAASLNRETAIRSLAASLNRETAIRSLAASLNRETAIRSLAASLNRETAIRSLAASLNRETAIRSLAASLNRETAIRSLAASLNRETAIRSLAASLNRETAIRSLAASLNRETAIRSLAASLNRETAIRSLAASLNRETAIRSLAASLNRETAIRSLAASLNRETAIRSLAASLNRETAIRSLAASLNRETAIRSLAASLNRETAIRSLAASLNRETAIRSLAASLNRETAIRSLAASLNRETAIRSLAASLNRETAIRSLAASLNRETAIRGSLRLGSVSSARVNSITAPDVLPQIDNEALEDEEEEEKEASVSSWQLLKLNAPEWALLAGGGVASFLIGLTMPVFAVLFSKVYGLNAPEWALLAGGGVASFLIGLTMPVFAVLFSKVYGMFASSDAEEILSKSQLYAGLFAIVAAVCGVVTFLQTWLFNKAGASLTDRLRIRTFQNFLRQEQAWFDQRENSVGALCARLATDCAAVQGATGSRLGTVLQGVSTMVLGVGLALPYSWKMTLVSLVSVPAVIGGICLEGYVTKKAEVKERKALEQASRVATEAVLNVRTVQSLGVEQSMVDRYGAALREAGAKAMRARMVRGPVYGLCLCAPTLGYAVSLAYGGYLIAREGLAYEYAILVSEALIYGAWMLAEALSFAPSFAAARRSGARIFRALDRQPTVVTEPTAVDDPNWKAQGSVAVSDLHFSYGQGSKRAPVLRGISLNLNPGQKAALVGASGCGKSTLAQLMLRNYDPDSGKMELDSKDIKRDLTLPGLRSQWGLVGQEPTLFARTLRENIAYGDNSREEPTLFARTLRENIAYGDNSREVCFAYIHTYLSQPLFLACSFLERKQQYKTAIYTTSDKSLRVIQKTVYHYSAQWGLVGQEPTLFARTLRENIAYGDNSREEPTLFARTLRENIAYGDNSREVRIEKH
ncbi:ABC transporter transmembrane region domain-containing protein [Phthorimaea operculella]|nr:ABC transporter transmembrane region domain-containing protein [Phthorimaea operculella]